MGAAFDRRQRRQQPLEWLLRDGAREQICATVTRLTGAPPTLVEEAFQEACQLAASGKCRGDGTGQVYNWLLTTTLRGVKKLLERPHQRHELPVDWRECPDPRAPVEAAEAEALARERERELAEIARTIVASLDERQRTVVALHAHRVRGRELAERLGMSERHARHIRAQTWERAREALVEAAGGGCERGERLIGRLSFGLATPRERGRAHLHLAKCQRCTTLYERLELVHDKVAALLPIPAAAHADPALVEHAVHKGAHALARTKEQLAALVGHAKQHAAAGYGRAAEYSALASARPGAAATAIAGCLALGGGTAAYCINQDVNPLGPLARVIPHVQAKPPDKHPPRPKPKLPAVTPADPVAQAPQTTPAQTQPVAQTQPSQQQSQGAPAKATPAAVQFGEPSSPPSGSSTTQPSSGGTTQASAQPSQPAKVPTGGVDLYGP